MSVCVLLLGLFSPSIHPHSHRRSIYKLLKSYSFFFLSWLPWIFELLKLERKVDEGLFFRFFLNFYLLGHTCSIFIGFFSFKLQKFNIKLGHRQRWLWQLIFHHQIENWAGFKPFGPNVETKKTPLVSRLEHFRKK